MVTQSHPASAPVPGQAPARAPDAEAPLVVNCALWDVYRPRMGARILRTLDPREAPSYGVPGDP